MDAADELLGLIKKGDIRNFNTIEELMRQINRRDEKQENDFSALEEGEKYVTEMQELLGRQNQRQNQ